jgi:lysophospholipase L1-like esterase
VSGAPFDLVTIALGANHAWHDLECAQAGARAAELAALAAAAPHRRIAWLLPSWKPFEAGKGPGEFAGVPLDRAAADSMVRLRSAIRGALLPLAPRIQLVEDMTVHDHRLLPDGLHPQALGAARYADALATVLQPPEPLSDGDTPTGTAL